MASQRARNASELTMAVHSVAVRALDARFEDLLGIMALTEGYKLPEKVVSAAPTRRFETMLQCSVGKFNLRDAAMRR
jgi:hypothetical protein